MRRIVILRAWQNAGVRTQLFCTMVFMFAVFSAVFFWAMRSGANTLMRRSYQHISELMTLEAKNLTEKFEQIHRMIYINGFEPDIQELLTQENTPYQKYVLTNRLRERFSYLQSQSEGVLAYVFIGPSIDFSTHNGLRQVKALQDATTGQVGIVHSEPMEYVPYPTAYATPAIIFGSHIYLYSALSQKMEYAGFSAIVYRAESLLISANQAQGTQLFLLDENGAVCAQSGNGERIGSVLDVAGLDEASIAYSVALSNVRMTLLSVTPREAVLGSLRDVCVRFLGLFAGSMLSALGLFFLFARGTIRPIVQLSRFIARLRFTHLDVFQKRVALGGSREIAMVSSQFNSMFEEIGALTQSLLETQGRLHAAELQKERAQLYSLRNQINPHFLYNTLECAKGIACQANVPPLAEMLDCMSRVFRYNVKGAGVVRLQEELEVTRAYLSIQQKRFPGRFSAGFAIEPQTMRARIPKMTLQPLIENAIFHGVEPQLAPCHLWICAKGEDGGLTLEVRDDGAGMNPGTLAALRSAVADPTADEDQGHSSIGLQNIACRIRLMYGEPWGVAIDSSLGGGTRVVVRIPLEWDGGWKSPCRREKDESL